MRPVFPHKTTAPGHFPPSHAPRLQTVPKNAIESKKRLEILKISNYWNFASLQTATYFWSSSTRPVFPRRTRAERANRVLELYQTPTRRGASLCTKHSHNGHFRARNQTLFAAWGQHDQYLALVLKFFGNFMAFPVRENWSRDLRLK